MKPQQLSTTTDPREAAYSLAGIPNPTVMIAEDDFEMRRMLTWSLEKAGYDVVECPDGMFLMRNLGLLDNRKGRREVDLVISDIRMPGFTGLQVLERSKEGGDRVPMILISAFADQEACEMAESLGAAALFPKPLDLDELVGKVREILPLFQTREPRQPAHDLPKEPLPFPLEVTFRHRSSSDPVRETIEQLAQGLIRFEDQITHCRLVIDTRKGTGPTNNRHHVSLIVSTPGRPVIVERDAGPTDQEENLYLALNSVFKTAIRNLKQKHRKSRSHDKKAKAPHPDQEGDIIH